MARAHGITGHVVVELITNREERVAPGSVLTAPSGPLEVRTSRPVPGAGHGSRWIVKFAGVDSRPAADALRGSTLRAAPLDDDPDTLWVHQLVGSTVVDQSGVSLGRVTEVQANPASDLLVLDSGVLVPLRFVTGTDVSAGGDRRVLVDVPAGLTDL